MRKLKRLDKYRIFCNFISGNNDYAENVSSCFGQTDLCLRSNQTIKKDNVLLRAFLYEFKPEVAQSNELF